MFEAHPNTGIVVEVGQEAPDFSLSDTEGRVWKLSEITAEKPVLLIFYRGDW